jgi:hypothetical protein
MEFHQLVERQARESTAGAAFSQFAVTFWLILKVSGSRSDGRLADPWPLKAVHGPAPRGYNQAQLQEAAGAIVVYSRGHSSVYWFRASLREPGTVGEAGCDG